LQGPVGYYMKHHPTRPMPVDKWALLSEKWEVIRQIRNDVCHPYPVPRDRARGIRDALRDLADQSVFQSLASLKARLRGHAFPQGELLPS
jgi:hypothetical protein